MPQCRERTRDRPKATRNGANIAHLAGVLEGSQVMAQGETGIATRMGHLPQSLDRVTSGSEPETK